MGYYDNDSQVKEYISMASEYYSDYLVNRLNDYTHNRDCLLELGSGPGLDFKSLSLRYVATASDYSDIFVEHLRAQFDDSNVLKLNAITLDIDEKFDIIYSNKVLQHLSKEELKKSIKRQPDILKPDGIVFHSFWYGDGEEFYEGLRFVYYNESSLESLFKHQFEIIAIKRYKEDKEGDSIFIVAKAK